MASTVKALNKKGLITPPKFLEDNVHYETIMGSMAYGVNKDDSDYDVYGFCIPSKDIIFPHLSGVIFGFDLNYPKFEVWQEHHIKDLDSKKEYDLCIYNVVKYFRLAANCTPNVVDSLFTPSNCVLHMSRVGNIVRENRKLFLCKKVYHSYKGYAYQQLSKIRKGTNKSNPKRKANIEKYGYDIKFAYHLVRLLNQAEQMLVEGELDLLANRKQIMSVRNGEWTLEELENYFVEKEKGLEDLYRTSKALPNKIQEFKIKQLLYNVLEEHYGSLSKCVVNSNKDSIIVSKIREILGDY